MQQRTAAQIEAARRNGAKSKGPTTQTGKATSAKNSVKHGLQSHKLLVIEGEDQTKFDILLDGCMREFQPETEMEYELVVEIAAARWRIRRSWSVETAMIDMEQEKQRAAFNEKYSSADPPLLHALAIRSLGRDFQLMDRYETRLRRSYDRAVFNFYNLRNRRQSAGSGSAQTPEPNNTFLPNEPGKYPASEGPGVDTEALTTV